VFDATAAAPALVRMVLPFDDDFRGGVSLDAVRVNGDAIADLILGAGNRGNSAVEVWDGLAAARLIAFQAYSEPSRNAPVRVAGLDTDSDGIADWILTAQGTDGKTREIRRFDAMAGTLVDTVLESDPDFFGAYFLDVLD